MSDTLNKLKQKRATIRARTTILIEKIKKELEKSEVVVENLEDYLSQLAVKEDSLNEIDLNIEDLIDLADLEKEVESAQEYKEKIVTWKSRLTRKVSNTNRSAVNETRVSNAVTTVNRSVKLPRINIEKFSGDPSSWQSFWNAFDAAIHSNDSLKNSEKFNYLKTYLEGTAASAVEGLPLTDSNYDSAIQILAERFGRRDIVINSHMNKLLNLKPVTDASDIGALRQLYDSCNVQIRCLESVGVVSETYGSLLCPILMKIIPQEIALAYNKKCQSNAEWNVLELLQCLKEDLEARERTSMVSTNEPQSQHYRNKHTGFKNSYFRRNNSQSETGRANVSSAAALHSSLKSKCLFCDVEGDHESHTCSNISTEVKRNMIMKQGRCFLCLGKGHRARHCKQKSETCSNCKKMHHRTLCDQTVVKNECLQKKDAQMKTLVSLQNNSNEMVLLQTVRLVIEGPTKKCGEVRCMLDGGSQRSFISKELSRKLNLLVVGEETFDFCTFGSSSPVRTTQKKVRVILRDTHTPGNFKELELLETPTISSALVSVPGKQIIRDVLDKGILLSDGDCTATGLNSKLHLLIGCDHYWEIVTGKIKRVGEALVAMETLFGWTLQGPIPSNSYSIASVAVNKLFATESDILSENLQQFWNLESLGILEDSESSPDKQAMELFESSICFRENRYEVGLPWKSENPDLDDNYSVAERRLSNLAKMFKRDPLFFKRYQEVLTEQLSQGVVEEVKEPTSNNNIKYYMPHRAVVREEKDTSKLRIVFDASSHAAGCFSLNDNLLPGPNLNPNLLGVLLRFRLHKVGLVADIEKAFLQISLREKDRDAVRFLWFKDSPLENSSPEIGIFRMTRVLFGAAPSPFLLAATIRHHLNSYQETCPEVCAMVDESLYVDDLVTGSDTETEALKIQDEATKILSEGGMTLRKWQSNSSELQCVFENKDNSPQSRCLDEPADKTVKVLGLFWNLQTDEILFDVQGVLTFLENKTGTKRNVLQTMSRIFDPLGLLTPYTVRIKCLFQELWKENVCWDDTLSDELLRKWMKWCFELCDVNKVRIPRYYFQTLTSKPEYVELHVFSDASPKAYGAAVYVRFSLSDGNYGSMFVTSKSRVAPLKKLSLPRLELMGALVAARLMKFVESSFEKANAKYFWTDSTITLHWILGNPNMWKPFVYNRIVEIQKLTGTGSWLHCPGDQNPADLVTRGLPAKNLLSNSIWWKGPEWLKYPAEQWPVSKSFENDNCLDLSCERRASVLQSVCNVESEMKPLLDLNNYSSLLRVVRVTAWILRFLNNVEAGKTPATKRSGTLSTEEISTSYKYWIRVTQHEGFPEDVERLKNGKEIKRTSTLKLFKPYLDDDKLMCSTTRLQDSEFEKREKEPWILPHKHRYSDLIAKKCHEELMHAGVTETLAQVRESYWIINGKTLVKRIIAQCLVCKRLSCKPCSQPAAPLPRDRITESPPFETCGVDFAGPLYVKNGARTEKSYILLFTCAVTRALHLELVTDMSTKTFLFAFRRFISRRGVCKVIYSDNAKSFKKASTELQRLWKTIKDKDLQDFYGTLGIKWKFIVEKAPWWGGFFERLVRSIKTCLKKVLGSALLKFDEMATVLTEVEAILNSRPLTYTYSEVMEPTPLSPSHFLVGQRLTSLPSEKTGPCINPETLCTRSDLTKRMKYREIVLSRFWRRWKREYILSLRSANVAQGSASTGQLKEGDIVLIHDDKAPKHTWKMAKVLETFLGRDNKIRSCLLKLPSGVTIRRPIQLLYHLELDETSTPSFGAEGVKSWK